MTSAHLNYAETAMKSRATRHTDRCKSGRQRPWPRPTGPSQRGDSL